MENENFKNLKSNEDENPFSFKNFLNPNKNTKTNEPSENFNIENKGQFEGFKDVLSESFDLPEIDFDGNIKVEAKFDPNDLTDNTKLKDEIIEDQKKKIINLEKKIKELINNEENENKTLEMVIQQVEKNLLKTTERAIKSEKNCEALNNELSELKLKLNMLTKENLILKKSLLNNNQDIIDSIKDIVFKLNNASDTAEKSLNSLLGGVNSLRLIANILESLGKIKEDI